MPQILHPLGGQTYAIASDREYRTALRVHYHWFVRERFIAGHNVRDAYHRALLNPDFLPAEPEDWEVNYPISPWRNQEVRLLRLPIPLVYWLRIDHFQLYLPGQEMQREMCVQLQSPTVVHMRLLATLERLNEFNDRLDELARIPQNVPE